MAVASYTSSVTKVADFGPVPDDASTKPHHITKNGSVVGFQNPYPSYQHVTPSIMFNRIVWPMLTGKLKFPDTKPPTVDVIEPEFLPSRNASDKLRATWLGHACFYVEFPSGLRVLFDPVFEDRCSPFSFLGPKRYTPRPCDFSSLPHVDAVVISHSHYDHLSYPSVLEIQKHHPRAHFFVGLGLESWFKKGGLHNVTEMDWWEDTQLSLTIDKTADGAVSVEQPGTPAADAKASDPQTITATISCLPCQHTSGRTLFDKDSTLWCSWAVSSGGKSVWFGGDTGYRAVVHEGMDIESPEYRALPTCPQFKQIGDLRGPFDLGLIPIGAYYPRTAMSGMHADPYDAVDIFSDTRCQNALGIHWGTWVLTMEEVLEPPKLLQDAMKRKGLPAMGVFDVCKIGQSKEY
ncbi:hypothetical protein ACRALDRAFT_2042144 [Sodiomyces alcalophilus JCM 7366]|uniref:uncharacterized protein n=1 Tax=Sodiomyces alcalophilus JCM 7366 TaxID=591952 RepID=UPI0039B50DA2